MNLYIKFPLFNLVCGFYFLIRQTQTARALNSHSVDVSNLSNKGNSRHLFKSKNIEFFSINSLLSLSPLLQGYYLHTRHTNGFS